jgi:hypothetical protein
LIDLYAERPGSAAAGEAAERSEGGEGIDGWLTLARRQRDELRARIDAAAAEQLPELRRRLAAADALAAQEPDRAAAIWQALVTLYGDKPWAADIVEIAQERLVAGAAE